MCISRERNNSLIITIRSFTEVQSLPAGTKGPGKRKEGKSIIGDESVGAVGMPYDLRLVMPQTSPYERTPVVTIHAPLALRRVSSNAGNIRYPCVVAQKGIIVWRERERSSSDYLSRFFHVATFPLHQVNILSLSVSLHLSLRSSRLFISNNVRSRYNRLGQDVLEMAQKRRLDQRTVSKYT